ncbi:MAG TPA: carboxypeptidase-like regulatory domain-containing protein [Planctomycetota bacterium]|nr:carboxypeptidase-like regulatory domain-containing protein [Planctomycetota bacterium]
MRASHALAAVFVVLMALVLWLSGGREPAPDSGPMQPGPAAAAAVETSANRLPGNGRSLVGDTGESTAPTAPSAPSAAPSITGNLHIVVHNERGDALPGCSVSAAEHEAITDATGSVTFTVKAGRTFVVVAPPKGSVLRARNGWQSVRGGSTTELTIELAPDANVLFWAQLLAAENGRPLPNVEVRVQPGDTLVRSDAEGCVQVAMAGDKTWLDTHVAGRCLCRILPEPGHETRAAALRVPLATGSTLSVHVVDSAEAAVTDVAIELRLEPWEFQCPQAARFRGTAFVFRASSDLGGRLSFADVPIGVTLEVRAKAPASFAAVTPQRWVLTAAHEERTIVLVPAASVSGRVVDDSGVPVAGVTVQATASDGPTMPRVPGPAEEAHRAKTAGEGTFRLSGLGAGRWWIGIPYGGKHQPTSVAVEVSTGGTVEVELRAIAGLPVAGRAFAPDGSPASGVPLEVLIDDEFVAGARTDAEGRFRFADLPAGTCKLRSDSFETDLGLPEPVTVAVGNEQVELRLLAVNGSISGRTMGSSDVWVTAIRRDDGSVLGMRCELDGSFFYRGMQAGTWDVTAMDRTGRAACQAGVQVLPGRETTGVLLMLEPAAMLAPKHGKADEFVVRNGEHVAWMDNLERGVAGEARVPPGTWTVVFLLRGKELSRREVTVQAGQELVVDGDR